MPLFDFRCSACGFVFEELVRRPSKRPPCPSCSSNDVEKLVSMPAIRSEQTTQKAIRDVKRRNRTMRRDYGEAELKRIEAHEKDHDH